MSKSDKNRRCAFPLFPGRPLRLNFGDRRCVPVWSTASVEWLLCGTPPPVNEKMKLSVVFVTEPRKMAKIRGF